MKNTINLTFITVVFVLLVLGCSGGANKNGSAPAPVGSTPGGNNATATAQPEKPVAVQAKALTKEYDDNELAADGKYKDKLLAVSGKVDSIAETFGQVSVQLEGHNRVITVMCSFQDSERDAVSKLKKSQLATLVGHGNGMTAGLYVGLDNCKVQ
jgi:hypothetical protein